VLSLSPYRFSLQLFSTFQHRIFSALRHPALAFLLFLPFYLSFISSNSLSLNIHYAMAEAEQPTTADQIEATTTDKRAQLDDLIT
jgi:hypothetical protein